MFKIHKKGLKYIRIIKQIPSQKTYGGLVLIPFAFAILISIFMCFAFSDYDNLKLTNQSRIMNLIKFGLFVVATVVLIVFYFIHLIDLLGL